MGGCCVLVVTVAWTRAGAVGTRRGVTSRLKYLVMGWGVVEGSGLIRRIPA